MRAEIIDYVENGGNELSPLVREAVRAIATRRHAVEEEVGEG